MNIKKIIESKLFEQISLSFLLYSSIFLILSTINIYTNTKRNKLIIISSPIEQSEIESFKELEFEDFSEDATLIKESNQSIEKNSTTEIEEKMVNLEIDVLKSLDLPSPKENYSVPNLLDISENINLNFKNSVAQENNITGVIDRLTMEIIDIARNKDLNVIWLFDASISLSNQRKNIQDRFEKILQEIDSVEQKAKEVNHTICSFGENLKIINTEPSNNSSELIKHIESIEIDESGTENIFQSIDKLVESYKKHKNIIIVFTDEVGDDTDYLEKCIFNTRKNSISVYVVGPPAPFGVEKIQFKYIDPDPRFDQKERWVEINQGPETLFKMTLDLKTLPIDNIGMDSGFGPFALTRLCQNTGGIYFSVHPNRSKEIVTKNKIEPLSSNIGMFFENEIMKKYSPDYRNLLAQQSEIQKDKTKFALIKACEIPINIVFDQKMKFNAFSEGEFSNELGEAQKFSARIEPKIDQIFSLLKSVEASAKNLKEKRWIVSYNLAMGRIMAAKCRIEMYNNVLAEAKSGLRKKNPKTNQWELVPSEDFITKNSQLNKIHETAKNYLGIIIENYPNTPWAAIAQEELKTPMGYKWLEGYVEPKKNNVGGGNNIPSPRKDDAKNKIEFKPQRKAEKI